MKIDTHNDVATTQPLNTEPSFREQLSQLKEQADNVPEVSNEPEETNTSEQEESVVDASNEGDASDSSDSELANDSLDDDFDPRAPVPVSRLKKEAAKRRAAEETLQQERTERIRAQTELDLINRALMQLQNPPQQQQDRQEGFDPLDEEAHRYYSAHYAQKDELAAIKAELHQTRTEQYQTRMAQSLDQQQSAFERNTPDFKDAYQHLYKIEIENIKQFGANEEQATHAATSKLQNMAIAASQQGKNVAEVFYNISKRYGYTPKHKSAYPASNLDAIETNMRKSRVADVPAASVPLGNGVSNLTVRENFEKWYDAAPNKREKNAEDFHKALKKLKEGK